MINLVIERRQYDGQGRKNHHRPTMGKDQTFTAKPAKVYQGWTTASEQSRLLRRDSLGSSQWRSLEGFARSVSFIQHLLEAFAGLGRTRSVGASMDCSYPRAGRARPTQLDGDFRRWNLFPGKKRGKCVGPAQRGKGTKLMVVASSEGFPVGVHLASASPHEVSLLEATLRNSTILSDRQRYLIVDRAYDSDPLRDRLESRGLEMICPHRYNRTKPCRQDGRKLRRFRRRWIVERTIAWLKNFRRLVVRWDHKLLMYRALVHVACIVILLRQF